MQELPNYERIFKEIQQRSQIDKDKFVELYDAIRKQIEIDKYPNDVNLQKQFSNFIRLVIYKLPKYYSVLEELIDGETSLELEKEELQKYLEIHYGDNNIHKIEVDLESHQSLSNALDKMYDNIFDREKLSLLTNFYYGVYYQFQFVDSNKNIITEGSDFKSELMLFDAIAQHDDLHKKLEEYIKLINAIHYSLGSEGDIRYPDERIIFEAPITALVKCHPRYILLLVECYGVYNRWHDVSAMDIACNVVSRLWSNADEMIYLYAGSYGRAMGNYELVDTFQDEIFQKLLSPEFRQRFIKLLAAENIATSIAMNYSYRDLKGDDLEEDLELDDWEDEYEDNTLADYLEEICSEEEYDNLKDLYNQSLQDYIYNPHKSPIDLFPSSYSSITGIALNDNGDKFNEKTPQSSVVFDISDAGFITYSNKDYLIIGDDDYVRIIDFEKKKQVTVRELSDPGAGVDMVLTTSVINNNSPVHFITYSEGIIQGWSLKSFNDIFKIRANVQNMFINAEGTRLAIITGDDDDDDYENSDSIVNIDLSNEKENTVIFLDLTSLTEISRWAYSDNYSEPLLTKDGNFLMALSEKGTVKWDTFSGKLIDTYRFRNNLVSGLEMIASYDSTKLIIDNSIFCLSDMNFIMDIDSYDFGRWYISQSNIIAKYGDTAYTEGSFCFSDIETGKVLGRLFISSDSGSPDNAFFSPCGKYFCVIIESDLKIWNIKDVLAGNQIEKFEIEFPNVPVSIFDGGRIISIGVQKGDFINLYENTKFELLNFGAYKSSSLAINSTSLLRKLNSQDAVFIEEKKSLIPKLGDLLGAKLRFNSKGVQRIFDFKIVISFPEQLNPETGEVISSVEWSQISKVGDDIIVGWEFANQLMLKPGTWSIEIHSMDKSVLYFRKLFFIQKEFVAVDYNLKKEFVGLYSDDNIAKQPVKETNQIYGKEGISFGLKFSFSCDVPDEKYKLVGEMEHPLFIDPITGNESTFTKRNFVLSNGSAIGFFRRFPDQQSVTPGLWTFRIKDPQLGTTLLEEQIDVLEADDSVEPKIEMIDSGIYTSTEKCSLYKNYPKANTLTNVSSPNVIELESDMIFGFRYKFSNITSSKQLAVMIYHPVVSSMFGDETEEDFIFDIHDDEPQFIGWVIDRDKYIVEGEWTIKVWEDEINEDEEPLFQTGFVTKCK